MGGARKSSVIAVQESISYREILCVEPSSMSDFGKSWRLGIRRGSCLYQDCLDFRDYGRLRARCWYEIRSSVWP
jgi:hypothetical protein